MKSQTVSNFFEFISCVETLNTPSKLMLFRGQAKKRNLLPSIARKDPNFDSTSIEKEMLKELRRMGNSILPKNGLDDWELLVFAQHFGMKTRLLDWTSNPLTALFFACNDCNDCNDCNVFVYVLDAEQFFCESQKGPFESGSTQIIKPNLNNPRIIAQHGWFTAHKYSKKAKKFVALEKNNKIKTSLKEIKITKEARLPLLKSLEQYGVSSRTLFPDLEGLCKYLNWKNNNI